MSQEVYELNKGLERIKNRIIEMKKKRVGPIIVGVAGGSGSGKTTKVTEKIEEMFSDARRLSVDDYFRGKEFMASINSCNWDEPRVYELELLAQHLKFLKQGIAVQKPIYSFKDSRRCGYESFKPKRIIVVEGLFALYPGVVDELDLKIFVDIAVHGSLIRRILRDTERTGQTKENIFKQYVETVYPMYKLHVEPTRTSADIVISNEYLPEIEAGCCESREFQIKAAFSERIDEMRLISLGFMKIDEVFQEDIYYAAPNWEKTYYDELMRVRKEGSRYFLTYKGPQTDGSLSEKPKIEFEVEPFSKDALKKLGYKEIICLKKRREKWLGCCLGLSIDEFEDGRRFLEFRAADAKKEKEIMNILKALGVPKHSITKKSYLELMHY